MPFDIDHEQGIPPGIIHLAIERAKKRYAAQEVAQITERIKELQKKLERVSDHDYYTQSEISKQINRLAKLRKEISHKPKRHGDITKILNSGVSPKEKLKLLDSLCQ